MRNKYDLKDVEVFFIIAIIIIVGLVLIISIGNRNNIRLFSMKQSAGEFSYIVATNIHYFQDEEVVYLKEAIDEKLIKNIKNPVNNGYCDPSQSKVEYLNKHPYVTLKCGKYLIDREMLTADFKVDIYEVSEWTKKKPEYGDYDEKTLYNCTRNGANIYQENHEGLYLIYMINKAYKKNYLTINDIEPSVCTVVKDTYYRRKKLIS